MARSASHLCVFTTMHPVGDVRVDRKIVQSFISKGWRITWIGPDRADFPANGARAGIEYKLHKGSGTRLSRFLSIPRLSANLVRAQWADVIYAPDPDSAAIALLLRPIHRKKVVFDIHENYHESALSRWAPKILYPTLSALLRYSISKLAQSADISTAVNREISALYSTNSHKPLVLRNFAPSSFSDSGGMSLGSKNPGGVLRAFHGKASAENGTETLLQAWALLKDQPHIRLVLIPKLANSSSDILPTLRETIQRYGIEHQVELLKPVPHDAMPGLLRSMDVGLISYQRDLGVDSLPNRFFEYLACGIPTVTPSYSKHIKEIVDRWECGLSIDMEDPSAIAEAIRSLSIDDQNRERLGIRGLQAFREELTWESEFEGFFEELHRRL